MITSTTNYMYQFINKLPSSIIYLTFGNKFNKCIDILLSNNITNLIFGNNFNQYIDNLPSSITHLELGYDFNQIG